MCEPAAVAPVLQDEPTTREGLQVLAWSRRMRTADTWPIAWSDFPGPMNEDEAEIWRARLRTWPRIPRDFDFDQLERRVIFAYERAGWTPQDCIWRDGEE